LTTGPNGGATVGEVPLERAFQLVQNYLFFRDVDVARIYAVRRVLEPELAAGAVPHLTPQHIEALERSIGTCAPAPESPAQATAQRQEDLHFHDILAAANPNALLRFFCEVINQLLRHGVAMDGRATQPGYRRLGDANVAAHRAILAAARNGDADEVRRLMIKHIDEAGRLVRGLEAAMHRRFILDSELQRRIVPRRRPSRQEKTP
jgi:DNA-binding FadR family transcriptional regulator